MAVEAGHVQIPVIPLELEGDVRLIEFKKTTIPAINIMLGDLFCRYGVAMPYFLLDFEFPDYPGRPDWITGYVPDWHFPEWKTYWPTFLNQWPDWLPTNGYAFGSDWGPMGYWLNWLNELLGLLFDEANLPREMLPGYDPKFPTVRQFPTTQGLPEPATEPTLDTVLLRSGLPSLSPMATTMFNDYVDILYEGVVDLDIYNTVGTFTVGEILTGETSGTTGVIKVVGANSLKLTNPSGIFADEEKVTGGDSGAYAYTYEEAVTQLDIYTSVGTFTTDEILLGETSGAYGTIDEIADDYLMLRSIVGTFGDDEKVTGQTSGAYAWTADWTYQMARCTSINPNHVVRYGYKCLSEGAPYCPDAWVMYENTPVYKTYFEETDVCGGCMHWGPWGSKGKRATYKTGSHSGISYICGGNGALVAYADRCFVEFDTTNIRPGAALIKFQFRILCRRKSYGLANPTIKLWLHDFGDSVDVGDWDGGTLLGSIECPDDGATVELEIASSAVNIGGKSRFKFSVTGDLYDTECGCNSVEFTKNQYLRLWK